MRRTFGAASLVVCVSATALSGQAGQQHNQPSVHPPARGALTVPEWFSVDHKARTVAIKVVASQDPSHTGWAFNDYNHGRMTITVPEGYKVTIEFANKDYMQHSLAIVTQPAGDIPTMPDSKAVFEGAATSDPTDEATGPGEDETITFTASKAGKYGLLCLVPSHASAGMWIQFTVGTGTEAGVQTST